MNEEIKKLSEALDNYNQSILSWGKAVNETLIEYRSQIDYLQNQTIQLTKALKQVVFENEKLK